MDDLPQPMIHLNGKAWPLPQVEATILTLLQDLGLAEVPVLVEHNKVALFPREFAGARLSAGDGVEIIRIVAGG